MLLLLLDVHFTGSCVISDYSSVNNSVEKIVVVLFPKCHRSEQSICLFSWFNVCRNCGHVYYIMVCFLLPILQDAKCVGL